MTRFARVLALSTSVLLISAGTVLADSPHQVGQTSVNQSGNSLTISASIAGLGNVPSVTLNLEGTVDVFSRCYNRGGNKPQADNKQETIAVEFDRDVPGQERSDQRVVHDHAAVDPHLPRQPGRSDRVVQLRPDDLVPGRSTRARHGLASLTRGHTAPPAFTGGGAVLMLTIAEP